MTTAKICGLSTPETIDAAIAGGASHVGLVFFPPSPRDVPLDRAAALATRVPSHIGRVGVFVDPDDRLVLNTVAAAGLSAIQLHGVTAERAAYLRRLVSAIETWVALAIRTRADLAQAPGLVGAADRIVYDAKTPPGSTLPGGMGLRFDWGLLDGFRHPLPWALSGGLDPANVAEAIRSTGAGMVDVSSGVESAPGVKQPARIAALLAAVSAA